MSGVPRDPRSDEIARQLRLQLPRILVLVGIGLMVLGVAVTIAFVAGDSGCNAVTNQSVIFGGPVSIGSSGGSFCGHAGGFLAISFTTLVLGAICIGMGAMVLPTLRARDARLARERAAVATAVAAAEAAEAPESPEEPQAVEAAEVATPPASPESDPSSSPSEAHSSTT
jgi:hypothetical protein